MSSRPDGCDVSPHCLDCPLVQCKYDDPTGYKLWKSSAWDVNIAQAHELSGSVTAVASANHVSRRTVYRSLNRTMNRTAKL
mgnify:CR=1 FL=1